MKRHFANMVFALILIAYTVYAALDTFVIVRVLTPDTLPTEAPTTVPTATESPAEQATTAPISTDTEYHDDQIDIVLTTMRVENTTVYVADVQIADISLLNGAGGEHLRPQPDRDDLRAGGERRGDSRHQRRLLRRTGTRICAAQRRAVPRIGAKRHGRTGHRCGRQFPHHHRGRNECRHAGA